MYLRKNLFRISLSSLLITGVAASILGGCTTARIPVTGLEVPVPDIPLPAVLRGENDLRGRKWTEAFSILHERLKQEYAFSGHKGIDWDALYDRSAAEVVVAQENADQSAWYLALRRYLHAVADGNIYVDPNGILKDAEVGASAGMALAQLNDGSVIVCGIDEAGPAAAAGIEWGATLLDWEGEPIAAALDHANILWSDVPPATPTMVRLQQLAWITRGPEEARRELSYMNPGDTEPSTTTLTLVADEYASLAMARPLWMPVELFSSPVSATKVSDDYWHIRVEAIAPTLSTPFPARDFRAAVLKAVASEATGIIIDVRGTQGGDSSLVPSMLGVLVEEESFLETPAIWDPKLEQYREVPESTVTIIPGETAYTGPVVILVDPYTMGPAETFAAFLAQRDNVHVFGEGGTAAATGVPGMELTLPGGYSIMYPVRRSLNAAGQIQGVSDGAGVGGVAPDTLFTLDRTTAAMIYQDGKDVVLNKAIENLDSSTWRFP